MDTTANKFAYPPARRSFSLATVNGVNSALMMLSCLLAYLVPLELFLFSYAVLGPLHYLTQISWLQKRGFFVRRRTDYAFLIVLCVLIAAVSVFRLPVSASLFVGIAFGSALAVLLFEKTLLKILAVVLVAGIAVLARKLPAYTLFFGVLLPSIIHVYVLTGLFILYGSLKSRSRSGYASLLVFISCSLLFFIISPTLFGITESQYLRGSYHSFERLNFFLARLLGFSDIGKFSDIYITESGVTLMRFVAFAYTYHYLNWFSKTSILKWHEVSRLRWAAILSLWSLSVAIYAIDYRLGLTVLFALSMAHVLLEFPLNYKAVWGIYTEVTERITSRAAHRGVPTVSG